MKKLTLVGIDPKETMEIQMDEPSDPGNHDQTHFSTIGLPRNWIGLEIHQVEGLIKFLQEGIKRGEG